MKVSVFGTGYVGLVTGACLAEVGHSVICMDVDEAKVAGLRKGILPIWEPGLQEIVQRNVESGHLAFTTDAAKAVEHGRIQIIAVGTPPQPDGGADLRFVFDVADAIGASMRNYCAVITKSTVPVGTSRRVSERVRAALEARGLADTVAFDVVSNPEFLKEGAAVGDFLKPDRIIVGAASERALSSFSIGPPRAKRICQLITRIKKLVKYGTRIRISAADLNRPACRAMK